MSASGNLYANFLVKAFAGTIDLTSDTINMALLSSSYTPNLTSDTFWSDVQAYEISGSGYTAGGVTLTSVSLTLTVANSWSLAWSATTNYSYGQIIRPYTTNGYLYRCVSAGTSGSSEPSWPTPAGAVVGDGSAGWACLGDAGLVFTSAVPQWTTATFNTEYAVIYDAQSGSATTDPLIALQNFGSVQSPSAQTFQVPPDSTLGWFCFSPPS